MTLLHHASKEVVNTFFHKQPGWQNIVYFFEAQEKIYASFLTSLTRLMQGKTATDPSYLSEH